MSKQEKLVLRCTSETKDYVESKVNSGEYETKSEFIRWLILRHKMREL